MFLHWDRAREDSWAGCRVNTKRDLNRFELEALEPRVLLSAETAYTQAPSCPADDLLNSTQAVVETEYGGDSITITGESDIE